MKQDQICWKKMGPSFLFSASTLGFLTMFLILFFLLLVPLAIPHPVPDVPVRTYLAADGSGIIKIEVDPRCFSEDPEGEPYLRLNQYLRMSQSHRDQMRDQALDYVRRTVEIAFEPGGVVQPDWSFEFTTFQSGALTRADDPVMLTGGWRLEHLPSRKGYQIRALPEGELSVLFLNFYQGQVMTGIQVLFPGESSRVLDLKGLAKAKLGDSDRNLIEGIFSLGSWATFVSFIRAGLVHVVPFGADHILFVLGLFLLSRKWRPLLWQVTTFTVAHTFTLGLATTGLINVPSSLVEPIIAGSIVVIALENVFCPRYSPWRLLVVFMFGLVHGLGFAGALSELELPSISLLAGLLGFNVGVEVGQLLVISLAFIATVWLRNEAYYRKFVVFPGSLCIAAVGAFWMVERVFFQ